LPVVVADAPVLHSVPVDEVPSKPSATPGGTMWFWAERAETASAATSAEVVLMVARVGGSRRRIGVRAADAPG
jgi:hypothetical protein